MPHVHEVGSGGDVPLPLLLLLLLANALDSATYGVEWNGIPVPIWNEQRKQMMHARNTHTNTHALSHTHRSSLRSLVRCVFVKHSNVMCLLLFSIRLGLVAFTIN